MSNSLPGSINHAHRHAAERERRGWQDNVVLSSWAAGLAVIGFRVLAVDADAQGSLTETMGFAQAPGLYDLIVRDQSFRDVLRYVNPEIYEYPERTGQRPALSFAF